MSGAVQPASSIRRLISGTAAAASGRFTVTRTISDPASASSTHWRAVAAASAVSVIVIDWTTTGAPPPTCTWPTFTPTVRWSLRAVDMSSSHHTIGEPGLRAVAEVESSAAASRGCDSTAEFRGILGESRFAHTMTERGSIETVSGEQSCVAWRA